MTEWDWERLKLDYERTLEGYWHLADLRFKLLAFVPTISGAAIALLTRTSIPRLETSILAGLGFLVSFGIILYDQRNTQFYNRAVRRAAWLEDMLRFPAFQRGNNRGIISSRISVPQWNFFGVPIGHDLGLALVYSPVLGAWAFAVVRGAWPSHAWLAASVGAIIAGMALIQFEWHDHKPKALWEWWQKRKPQDKGRASADDDSDQ